MICSGIVYTKQSMYYYDNHVRGSAESLLTNQFNERKRVLNTAQLTTMCIYIYIHTYVHNRANSWTYVGYIIISYDMLYIYSWRKLIDLSTNNFMKPAGTSGNNFGDLEDTVLSCPMIKLGRFHQWLNYMLCFLYLQSWIPGWWSAQIDLFWEFGMDWNLPASLAFGRRGDFGYVWSSWTSWNPPKSGLVHVWEVRVAWLLIANLEPKSPRHVSLRHRTSCLYRFA